MIRRLNPIRSQRRAAFTLVEMLIVIVIIGILAGVSMAALFASQQAARRARTEGFIATLNNQMVYRWDSYRTRRVKTTPAFDQAIQDMWMSLNNPVVDPPIAVDGQRTAALQLMARRQMMRIELPDRWWDVAFDDSLWIPTDFTAQRLDPSAEDFDAEVAYTGDQGPAYTVDANQNKTVVLRTDEPFPHKDKLTPWTLQLERVPANLITRTAISYSYQRRYLQVIQQRGKRPTNQFQGAECLYMILTTGMGDETSGGGTFNQQDFADVDGDGMPEFVDGWGRPITFLRWAPGFRSELQTGDPVKDHDPFDPRGVDTMAFRLSPLISSSGPDGVEDDGVNEPQGIESHAQAPDPETEKVSFNDPYAPAPSGTAPVSFRGELQEEAAGFGPNDNIFNQMLLVR